MINADGREPRISVVPVASIPAITRGTGKFEPFAKIVRELAPGKALRIAATDRRDANKLARILRTAFYRRALKVGSRIADDAVYFWRAE